MPTWRKLHVKVVESLDVNDMPDDFTRLLWVLLPTQLCREGRGIDSPSWVRARVFPLRQDVTLEMVGAALDWFAQRGMIRRYKVASRSYFWVPSFAHYQGKTLREAESEYPAPPDQLRTSSGPAPDQLRTSSSTDSDVDSDADTYTPTGVPVGDAETASPPAQGPVLAPDPEPKPVAEHVPKAKRERVSTRDPRTGHPSVQAYRSITGKLPPKPLYDAVIATLGENGPPGADVGRARDCYHAWLARGYNPSALTWLLEWYKTGIPKPDGGNGKRASPQTVPEVDWVAYAKEVEARRHGDATAERASQHG